MKQLEPDPWLTVGRALPGRQPRHGPRGQRHRLRRLRRAGAGRGGADPRQRDDLVAAHEASLQGGQSPATRWRPWCSRCTPRTAGSRWASSSSKPIPGPRSRSATASARWSRAGCASMTDFGAFIEIEEGIDGLVHVSDLSWTKRVKHPSEVLKKGQIVQAVILAIDAKAHQAAVARHQAVAAGRLGDVLPRAPSGRRGPRAGLPAPASACSSNWPKAWKGLCHNSEIPGATWPQDGDRRWPSGENSISRSSR